MSNKIRAKFWITGITQHPTGERRVTMSAVTNGSEENKSFSKYTPTGSIELMVTNPDAEFSFGEYYIDISKVEPV